MSMESLIEKLQKFDQEGYKNNEELKGQYAVVSDYYSRFVQLKRYEDFIFLHGVLTGLHAAGFITEEDFDQVDGSLLLIQSGFSALNI